jgi:hypothetical protein
MNTSDDDPTSRVLVEKVLATEEDTLRYAEVVGQAE